MIEVTIRRNNESSQVPIVKNLDPDKASDENVDNQKAISCRCTSNHRFDLQFFKPQLSDPDMFSNRYIICDNEIQSPYKNEAALDHTKMSLCRRVSKIENDCVQLNVHPATKTDLRLYNSLTSLSKFINLSNKGSLKSKIPSLTSINPPPDTPDAESTRYFWGHWDGVTQVKFDSDKRCNLQISKSSNNNCRHNTVKLKKDDSTSVSDSRLLCKNSETKEQIKKCDKKSRGDSMKKERESKKQVQWKAEVDVIYFSTQLAANGDWSGEVIGRVIEPLREEWEQQRKGFYAKMGHYPIENHLQDRFISLLKI